MQHRNDDDVELTADRFSRTERAIVASEQMAAENRRLHNQTADDLEDAMSSGTHDQSIVDRVSDLIAYLRSDYKSDGPLVELIREPIPK